MKAKDKNKLMEHLEHLKRVQNIDKTWNFSSTSIVSALLTVNKESPFISLARLFPWLKGYSPWLKGYSPRKG